MGLRDLFKRQQKPAPQTPPKKSAPLPAADGARLQHRRQSPPAAKQMPPQTIKVDGVERPAPLSFQRRVAGHVYYTRRPPGDWGIVDLFDYWLDLTNNLHGNLLQLNGNENYKRPQMDVAFERVWESLTEKRGYRPSDIALLMRWSVASGEIIVAFEREGMLGFKRLIPSFEEKTEMQADAPVRVFKDPVTECSHAVIHWKLHNLDGLMEILARTYGFPAAVATLRGINPSLGPDLVRRAAQFIVHEQTYLDEIALTRLLHREIVPGLPPDDYFLQR